MTVHMTPEDFIDWQVSVEERLELLQEIEAGDERERALRAAVDAMDDTLRTFEAMLTRDNDVIHNLRVQLFRCEARRTTALAPPGSATEDPQLNRFSNGTPGRPF
jgi:hypothetical protein